MDSWAVITGASTGLGAAFTRRLASHGSNVVLVARTASAMQRIADDVTRAHGVKALVLPADLTDRAARAELIERLGRLDVRTLVNNAGFANLGEFLDTDSDRLIMEAELNVVAPVDLARALLPQMIARGNGSLINVASTAGFQPIPQMATYAASKAHVLSLSNALWLELQGTGVRVVCVCPGPTETDFFVNAGNDGVMRNRRTPDQVIDTAFAALHRNQPHVVDGWFNKMLVQANRFVPTHLAMRISSWIATH